MYQALKLMGKEVDVVIPEHPKVYDFLPCADEIKTEGRNDKNYDLGIALDCTDTKRLEGFDPWYDNAKIKISIDHHSSNSMFADLNFVNPVAPACTQILIVVIKSMGIEINKDIGKCILAGIITDTFEFVADLLRLGVNVSETYKKVLQIKTKANYELTKIALNRMEFFEDGKIAFTYITMEDEEKTGAETGDHEGVVEMGRDIEGVEVSIFLRESEKGFKASLRSNEYVNVSEVASIFSGGGHVRAAGCTLPFTFPQAKEKIIDRVKLFLK